MSKELNYEKAIFYIIISIMILVPSIKFLSYILYVSNIIKDSFMLNQVYVLWVSIPILLLFYIIGIIIKKIKINYIDIIIYILIVLAVLSTIFSINVKISLLGEVTRNEGLLSLLNYYLIFLNCKNFKNDSYKYKIINCFLILGIFQVIYAIFQVYTTFNFVKRFTINYLAMSLCANPNFFGSYIVMLLLLSTSLYLLKRNKIYIFLSIMYTIGLRLAGSTGPFIGFCLAFIFFALFYHKKYKLKNIIILTLTIISTFIFTDLTAVKVQKYYHNSEINNNYNIIGEISNAYNILFDKKNNGNSLGNGRIKIWKNLLPKTKDYLVIGSGLDTIKYVYPQNGNSIVDKAHNVYLQIAITNGLPALILYLTLCLIVFIKGFKLKDNLSISLFIAFIGYSIQAFANISVIDVAPYFFIIIGLLCSYFNSKENTI